MFKLRFYGGVGTIGGNMIQVTAGKNSVLLDLGKSYDIYDKFFGMGYRNYPMELEDLILSSLLPRELIGNLFIDKREQKAKGESPVNAVFISHAHLDHSWFIPLVREDIPVYMNRIAYLVYRATMGKPKQGRSVVDRNVAGGLPSFLNINLLTTKGKGLETIELDDLKIYYGPVDHSVPGAYAYALERENHLLLYTGDFRLHGIFTEKARSIFDVLEDFRRDFEELILITEGTNWGSEEPFLNEKQVEHTVRELLRRHYKNFKIAIALVSPNDIDRVRELLKAACLAAAGEGRELVPLVDHGVGKLLALINSEKVKLLEPLPGLGEKIEAKTATTDGLTLRGKSEPLRILLLGEKRYTKAGKARRGDWHGYLVYSLNVDDSHIVDLKTLSREIEENEERYFILLSSFNLEPFYLKNLFKPGTLVLFSMSEPFKEELILDYQKKLNQLLALGARIARVHTSGHVRPEDHVEFLAGLRPDVLIPVHTEHPYYAVHLLEMAKVKSGDPSWNPRVVVPQHGSIHI